MFLARSDWPSRANPLFPNASDTSDREKMYAEVSNSRLSFGTYPQYVDPHNPANAYSRGPVSVWLKYKMVVVGRDPADQAEPEEFETAHLNLVA